MLLLRIYQLVPSARRTTSLSEEVRIGGIGSVIQSSFQMDLGCSAIGMSNQGGECCTEDSHTGGRFVGGVIRMSDGRIFKGDTHLSDEVL